MILIIDNYDSFVHNLGRYVENLGREIKIVRNDKITLDEIRALRPEAIILSPGPCGPDQAGICLDLIRSCGPSIPILGVCLGHQCIAQIYGGSVTRSEAPLHGKASAVYHKQTKLFDMIPSPFMAGRYHSLKTATGNGPLIVTAESEDGTIMALEHPTHPVYGLQFHPESILTEHGSLMLENFLRIAAAWNETRIAA